VSRPDPGARRHGRRHPGYHPSIDAAPTAWTVQQALASLSPEHRAVLSEVYVARRSVTEAAGVLGLPERTVRSRTYFALRAFKLALEERGVSPAHGDRPA
jgi:RNA polymerase sigma-70 factor, ECF subfamily